MVDEEVAFNVLDQDTLRGFSDPFTEEEEDDDDEDNNQLTISITEGRTGRYTPSIEAQRFDWWDDHFYAEMDS